MTTKPRLIHCYDTLCVWSYAVTPLMDLVETTLSSELDTEWIHAALYTGPRRPRVSSSYKRQMLQSIEDIGRLNQRPFGEAFVTKVLNNDGHTIDSSLSANITYAARLKEKNRRIQLHKDLQKAFFQDGNPLTNLADVQGIMRLFRLKLEATDPGVLTKGAKETKEKADRYLKRISAHNVPVFLLEYEDRLETIPYGRFLKDNSNFPDYIRSMLSRIQRSAA